jgi:hypothetical protein
MSRNSRELLTMSGEMADRVRRHDWAATPLGESSSWPQSLKTAIRIMLSSRYAMWSLWGPDLTFFCNDGRLDPGVEMIVKPFTYQRLAQKISKVLDAGSRRKP